MNKKYILDMFPYPSGEGLHVGHVESYTATDIISRYYRLKGLEVLHPQGFDAFGLPAENYAIKTGVHPAETTKKAIANFKRQMDLLGLSYDWDREINTSDPKFYKWTQWLFLQLYKKGLAYKKKAPVNWCDSCKTVLANEQVVDAKCERCGNTVIQKDLEQWFFKVTEYAEELLKDIDKMDWPEALKHAQKNWIGKSDGSIIEFRMTPAPLRGARLGNVEKSVEVFTTRPDTLFGATYLVMAPEHEIVNDLLPMTDNRDEIENYIKKAKTKNKLERTDLAKEKTGVELKGVKAINPGSKEEIPIWIADYVLTDYGTGAIMAVPAHDERDWEFANVRKIKKICVIDPISPENVNYSNTHEPIRKILVNETPEDAQKRWANENYKRIIKAEVCFTGVGKLINSDKFTNLTSEEAKDKIIKLVGGKKQTQYKIRDWLISRQRYWGAPIPIIYCDSCSNKERVLILHGWEESSQTGFFPALKKDLENKGYEVFAFDAPNTDEPDFDVWHSFIEKKIKEHKLNNFILIGHSMGGHLALKLAEKHKIKKLVLVAPVGFSPSENYFNQFTEKLSAEEMTIFKNYQNRKLNTDKVKKNALEINFIFGEKDPWITTEIREYFNKNFTDAKIQILPEKGHMSESEGVKKLEEIEDIFQSLKTDQAMFPVSEKDLPVLLPTDVDFKPTGESPLARSKEFHQIKCPKCGGQARRESDTMDTFVCSSWYFLRYADPENKEKFASSAMLAKWLPVDLYIGGMEHAVGHLIYSRFMTKALADLGYLNFREPFIKIRNQGIILAEDSRKMSKRWGNVINPDDVVKQYGADTLRMYEMFMGPLEDMKPWDSKGIIGVKRFLDKIYNIISTKFQAPIDQINSKSETPASPAGGLNPKQILNSKDLNSKPDLEKLLHKTIKKVTEDIENLRFNTAISAMMIFVNEVSSTKDQVSSKELEKLLIILSPFAPFTTEELWKKLGHKESIFKEKWPEFDEKLLIDEVKIIVIQVNGKKRDEINISPNSSGNEITENEIKAILQTRPKLKQYLEGKEVKKFIYIKDKLVNIVV